MDLERSLGCGGPRGAREEAEPGRRLLGPPHLRRVVEGDRRPVGRAPHRGQAPDPGGDRLPRSVSRPRPPHVPPRSPFLPAASPSCALARPLLSPLLPPRPFVLAGDARSGRSCLAPSCRRAAPCPRALPAPCPRPARALPARAVRARCPTRCPCALPPRALPVRAAAVQAPAELPPEPPAPPPPSESPPRRCRDPPVARAACLCCGCARVCVCLRGMFSIYVSSVHVYSQSVVLYRARGRTPSTLRFG